MSVQIEEGRDYLAVDGEVWINARPGAHPIWTTSKWCLTDSEGRNCFFTHAGLICGGGETSPHDLVEETAPIRVQILNEGAALTNGSRDVEYGPPAVNMAAAGELKAVFRKHARRDISQAELEAIDLALTKLGRIATGAAPKRDTYVDCATYIAIAGEIALKDA